MTKNLKLEDKHTRRFEIEIVVRDLMGRPTGKTKTYSSDNADEIDDFWQRNCYKEKKTDSNAKKPNRKNRKSKE